MQYENVRRPPSGTVSTRRDAPEPLTGRSLTAADVPYAATGIKRLAATTNHRDTSMNALVAENRHTELKNAVSQRRQSPQTPLVADQWEHKLCTSLLYKKYPQIPEYIRHDASAQLHRSYVPFNKESTETIPEIFNEIIKSEFDKGRYIGPFLQEELEGKIGPFQSSPLSLVPKAGKPGKYRLVQNLSHPHNNLPIPSINSLLKLDDFPCTWGTFRTVCTLIRHLPRGSQAATRDISKAYRIIPLHESQWPGVVVQISNLQNEFALNTSNSFGGTTAGGLFGLFGDALADLL